MSTTHDSPPPIPPKPNTPDRNSKVGNVTNIDQLLNLIDNELGNSRSEDETWNQATVRQQAPVDPKHQAMPLNINTNTHFSETTTNASSMQPHQMQPQHATTAYNYGSSSSNASHAYPPQPNYNPPQQYYNNNNYNGRQYQYQGAYTGPYYASYPRDLTSHGWPSQTPAYPPNSNTRPLPNPPSNTAYPHNQSIQYSHNMYSYGVPYVPSTTNVPTAMPAYPPVMPDFHKYIDKPAGPHIQHIDQNIQPRRSPQQPTQPVYPQELPYDAYPTDYTHNYPHSPGHAPNMWPSTSSQMTSIKPISVIPEAKKPHPANPRPMNPALLSYIALAFRAKINLGTHTKGALEYPESFTGKDAVSTIHILVQHEVPDIPRHIALSMARSLEAQLYFHSVYWANVTVIKDTEDEVYVFLNPDPESPTVVELDEDFPTGVFPIIAKCYSPSCSTDGKGCYSRICPNYVPGVNEKPPDPSTKRPESLSPTDVVETPTQDRTWVGSVSKEILESLSKEEIKRQEIIFETIYTEEDYVKDLDLIEELYIKGLYQATPPVIPPAQLEGFIQEIFFNVLKIRNHNRKMLELLQKRQKENPVVSIIGDIFLECALEFGNDYIDYNGHFPIADNHNKATKLKNPEYKRFLEQCSRSKEARRLDFRHFIQRPTTRLQRYTLLLEQIKKHTPDENPDKNFLDSALQTVRQHCSVSDSRVHEAENRLKILEIERRLVKKDGGSCNELNLSDPNRQLLFKGELQRRTNLDKQDLVVFLFDNYLIMTKEKKGPDGEMKYYVSKKPIPLSFLIVDTPSETLQAKTTTFHINIKPLDQVRKRTNSTMQSPSSPQAFVDLESQDTYGRYPFTILHIGRHGGQYQLFADSSNTRKLWKDRIQEAQTKLLANEAINKQIFEIFTLNDCTFVSGSSNVGALTSVSRSKVTCSVPFVTTEKRNMVAIGAEDGVWMGFGGEVGTFKQVLTVSNVTQMAVLEDFGIFIVLCDRTLWAFSLDAIIPSSSSASSHNQPYRQRLSAGNNVQYFNVGVIKERNSTKEKTLVVYMKKRGLESHFKALEPICVVGSSSDKSKTSSSRRGAFASLIHSKTEWFKEYKQFYIPSESYSVNFLRSRLCVVCTRGFEIVNLDTLQNVTIPDLTDPSFAQLGRRPETSKPLGMFRLNDDEFLLCYDDIFFYVNKHGELSRKDVMEWEGHPEAVALHLPYIIGFDPLFIEIHDVETGKLLQVIAGKSMRCLNDNSSGKHSIQAVMQHPYTDAQYIFQLVAADIRRHDSYRSSR
ncbi:CNH domain-containing protein [Gigaspora rosea]|uniref:CNH domain-containing protein n=1 Tax=Gigaspora rosea TaxID=44941 RepID=A0A397W8U6_9GLOM|nr:CNH domain-containing protein [Gigaspora rosea]